MAKKKSSTNSSAKEARKAAWEEKNKPVKKQENTREEFRKFFIQLKKKLNLKPELENIMWLHFKASGFDSKEKFEAGTKHFGYEIK